MKRTKKATLTLALGSAIAASLSPLPAAAESPFALQPLANGYQIAAADKAMEGKCGEGVCGAAMAKTEPDKAAAKPKTRVKDKTKVKTKLQPKPGDAKAAEAKCGGNQK